ncbi:BRCA1-associated protein [Tachypleus tridentatus]|uniref:BRCA1-associated protein n=1 Tax=Tachypleus tridentatus TaxID=6853 RepID=UPI003FD212CA
MSICLVILRFEIASDYSLIPDLHYTAPKVTKIMAAKQNKVSSVKKETTYTEDESSQVTDEKEKDESNKEIEREKKRGCRELHKITVETLTNVDKFEPIVTKYKDTGRQSKDLEHPEHVHSVKKPELTDTSPPFQESVFQKPETTDRKEKKMGESVDTCMKKRESKKNKKSRGGTRDKPEKQAQEVDAKRKEKSEDGTSRSSDGNDKAKGTPESPKVKNTVSYSEIVTLPIKESEVDKLDIPENKDLNNKLSLGDVNAPINQNSSVMRITVVTDNLNAEETFNCVSESEKELSLVSSEGGQNVTDKSSKNACSQIQFYSGNHFVEVTKGILHLYKENQSTPVNEEAERSEMLCILAVPATMTSHDLLQYTAAFSSDIEHIRIIRDAKPNLYMVLLKFRTQKMADEFYKSYNGVRFNTIEPELCHLVYVAKVETVKESEEICMPLSGLTELPTCPVCLERMDESVEGILTILCNHSFHGTCLSKWGDTSCPVCRYCQTPEAVPDNHCFGCGSQESLWICLICGHVGCGRYVDGHAFKHYVETEHTYALHLGNNRVWDYAGDNYVHRLVQSKGDGKPVELESNRLSLEQEEKLDSVQLEYTYLLTSQLEAQRHFFEDRIARVEKEMFRQLEELKEKTKQAVEERKELEEKLARVSKEKQTHERKVSQLTGKLNKLSSDLKEEKEMNKCLRQYQQQWQDKLKDTEHHLMELKENKEKEINDLKDQVRDLMFYLEAQEKLQHVSETTRQEIEEGQIVVGATGQSHSSNSRHRRRKLR